MNKDQSKIPQATAKTAAALLSLFKESACVRKTACIIR